MKLVFYTNLVSPHTVPLAVELRKLVGSFLYVYQNHGGEPFRTQMALDPIKDCAICEADVQEQARTILRECDVLLTGVRDFGLMQDRIEMGLLTFYQSERWFKPICLTAISDSENARGGIWMSGFWKNILPFAFRRARRIVRLMQSDLFVYLPIGVHAAEDMARLCGVFSGDLRCLFRAPKLNFERRAGGKLWLADDNVGAEKRYCLERMRIWGYYVSQSNNRLTQKSGQDGATGGILRVLWVGRLLNLKRVDVIIRAVIEFVKIGCADSSFPKITLDIYGGGPEEDRLRDMACGYEDIIKFFPSVSISEVRKIMRDHDVYVLSSNAFEGWGAVVSEALEEGMKVIGTYESGASATMLPDSNLFHAGDWRALLSILQGPIGEVSIGEWSVRNAAMILAGLLNQGDCQ